MKQHRIGSAAREELSKAARYYENLRQNLGLEFLEEFEEAVQQIIADPEFFPVEIDQFRICVMKRFPYSIVYENRDTEIWITAVAHHRQQSHYWSRRRLD